MMNDALADLKSNNNNSAFNLTPMQLFISEEAYTDDFSCNFVAEKFESVRSKSNVAEINHR